MSRLSEEKVIIVGAGGHARVLADALMLRGIEVIGFTDPLVPAGTKILGLPVLGDDESVLLQGSPGLSLVNGLGYHPKDRLKRRCEIQRKLMSCGHRFVGVRHPSSIVSPFAHMANDVQILAGAVINACAVLGEGVVVNTGACVEHDVELAPWTFVGPGAVVCGGVHVGEGSLVGAGAVIRQTVRLGPRTTVGAGASVVSNSDGDSTMLGVPARRRDRIS